MSSGVETGPERGRGETSPYPSRRQPDHDIGRAFGAALYGIEAMLVEVQVAHAGGEPRCAIVGQAEPAVKEGRERLRVALLASGLWPQSFVDGALIINLAPADVPKAGTGLDLAMCLGVAALEFRALRPALAGVLGYAEVGLDGRLRPAKGTLSAALTARERGLRAILVPPDAAREAAEVDGLEVLAVRSLRTAVDALRGSRDALSPWPPPAPPRPVDHADLADVKGQTVPRRALEIAAAGGHNLLMIGPPGAGKTLLARRLPGIIPPLTRDEALEVTRVHSAAGLIRPGSGLVRQRPFRAPHHSISAAGLVGGGAPPRPGEISLANHGVLFLDELTEFPRAVLDTLRQPLEDGEITISRALGSASFPTRFVLVAAMNPCPCGWHGSGVRDCLCGPALVRRYRSRISGPLADRIDLHVDVRAVPAVEIARGAPGEPSAVVRERVAATRRLQVERNGRYGVTANARLRPRDLVRACTLTPAAHAALEQAMNDLGLSARAHDRILRVARTIADLAGQDAIDVAQIGEAAGYRVLDRMTEP